jgi:hypothetical protein
MCCGNGEIAVDHLEGFGVDDVDLAGDQVGRIDAVERAGGRRADVARRNRGVDVLRVDLRRHVQVGGRQLERRRRRPEFVGRFLDEVVRRPAVLDMGAAEGGADLAVDAQAGDGQRLRAVGQRIRTDADGEGRGGDAGQESRIHCSHSRRVEPAVRGRPQWPDSAA